MDDWSKPQVLCLTAKIDSIGECCDENYSIVFISVMFYIVQEEICGKSRTRQKWSTFEPTHEKKEILQMHKLSTPKWSDMSKASSGFI